MSEGERGRGRERERERERERHFVLHGISVLVELTFLTFLTDGRADMNRSWAAEMIIYIYIYIYIYI